MIRILKPVHQAVTAAGLALLTSCAVSSSAVEEAAASGKLTPKRAAAISKAMDDLVREGQIPGGLVLISEAGQTAYSEALGLADKERGKQVSDDTIFRLYSMTKPITCATVMTLYDDGLISLDDPIKNYLPEFSSMTVRTEEGIVPAAKDITVRHLMTHTAGLSYAVLPGPVQADYLEAGVFAIDNRLSETLEDHVKRLATLPLVAEPGTVWNYGESMGVLGRLVEAVSGKPFSVYMQERILQPLSMEDTGFFVPEEKSGRLAELYHLDLQGVMTNAQDAAVYGGNYLEKPVLEYGGAGLVGTAGDYMNFARMLLDHGSFAGRQVLSPKAVELMTTDHLGSDFGEAPLAASGRGAGTGFGLCGYVTTAQPEGSPPGAVGEYGWSGWASTGFWIDPQNDIAGLVFTQVIPDDIGSVDLTRRVREAIYSEEN